MIVFFFLIWALFPVHEDATIPPGETVAIRATKFRELWICPPNSPVWAGVNVYWFDRHGEIYFYKPLEIQINREWYTSR